MKEEELWGRKEKKNVAVPGKDSGNNASIKEMQGVRLSEGSVMV